MSDSEFPLTPPEFMEWKMEKTCSSFSETVLLAYFSELAQQQKPSTVHFKIFQTNYISETKWERLHAQDNCDFYESTQISDFLNNAPDEVYLMAKVVVVFGIAGACRICEVNQVRLDDIEDSGTFLIVKLKQTKNDVNRRFVVTEEYIKFYRIYRPFVQQQQRIAACFMHIAMENVSTRLWVKINFIRYLKQ
ncbi:hypothetical protein NQ318_012854 [Aromia moschata]|uniref:Tyr recombinase domain-containing protein n=1 Tax=Aromia moschata TaxID=1265417 RepID=A0AAV8YBT7_9CUCU|nr:hypothetical protein NQ318_012854 [Aromia moschata]